MYVTSKNIPVTAFTRRVEAVGCADAERVPPVGLLYRHARHEQSHDLLACGEGFGRVLFDFGYALPQCDEPRVGRVGKLVALMLSKRSVSTDSMSSLKLSVWFLRSVM